MLRALALLFLLVGAPAAAQEAQELTQRAAYDHSAAFELALRMELGLGMPADPAAGGQMCRAAMMGSQAAALHLAAMHLTPDLPTYDPAIAAAWLRFAQTRARLGASAARKRAPACPGGAPPPDGGAPLAELVTQMALERGLDPLLVKAVITVESAWRADAVSHAGAQGLMQLMPGTGRRLGVADPFDVRENLRGGMDHLALLLRRFGGDETLALAAYNAGEAPVAQCMCVPPFAETTAYVRRVLQLAARRPPAESGTGPAGRVVPRG